MFSVIIYYNNKKKERNINNAVGPIRTACVNFESRFSSVMPPNGFRIVAVRKKPTQRVICF